MNIYKPKTELKFRSYYINFALPKKAISFIPLYFFDKKNSTGGFLCKVFHVKQGINESDNVLWDFLLSHIKGTGYIRT